MGALGTAVRKAIRDAGANLFFLPKYSPDLSPIEKFFAKVKHWLRKAAARSADAVCNAIADILPLTFPAECSNCFAQAYASGEGRGPESLTQQRAGQAAARWCECRRQYQGSSSSMRLAG